MLYYKWNICCCLELCLKHTINWTRGTNFVFSWPGNERTVQWPHSAWSVVKFSFVCSRIRDKFVWNTEVQLLNRFLSERDSEKSLKYEGSWFFLKSSGSVKDYNTLLPVLWFLCCPRMDGIRYWMALIFQDALNTSWPETAIRNSSL